eukprot:COSAG01_NODE_10894_length_2058_cov_1.583971_2_plen_250_part_00
MRESPCVWTAPTTLVCQAAAHESDVMEDCRCGGEVTSSGCEEPFLASRVPCVHASAVSSQEKQRLVLGALPGAAVHCCRASTYSIRARVERVGSQNCRIVRKSQPVLDCDPSHYLPPHPYTCVSTHLGGVSPAPARPVCREPSPPGRTCAARRCAGTEKPPSSAPIGAPVWVAARTCAARQMVSLRGARQQPRAGGTARVAKGRRQRTGRCRSGTAAVRGSMSVRARGPRARAAWSRFVSGQRRHLAPC